MFLPASPPARSLTFAGLICIAVAVGSIVLATATPWLGLGAPMKNTPTAADLVLRHPTGPAAGLQGRTLVSLGGMALRPDDLLDEPDYLPGYGAAEAFWARQTDLVTTLRAPSVAVVTTDSVGRSATATLTPVRRPISSLPVEFWVQIGFALGSLLIAAWVWSLRPHDVGAVMFGLSGVGMLISAPAAAIYSSRELALDGALFRALSSANHFGPLLFSYAMTCLFLVYPTRLAPGRVIWGLAVPVLAWFCADALHLAPSANWGTGAPMLLMLGAIAVIVVLQWRATRQDPVGRTALRWLGLTVVISSAAAMLTLIVPTMMGLKPLVPQSYAFGFFFLIYVSLALGLRRSRLFQLDEWAFRLTFYAGAGLVLVAVDAALVIVLHANSAVSIGASLLAVGFIYLPVRDWLWRRLVVRRRVTDEALFGHIVDTALAAHPAERAERWRILLGRLFEPLQIEVSPHAAADVEILADGMALALPATAASPALVLRAPWSGRGLFGPSHLRLARQAMEMIARTETSRDAYERGAAEERLRLAQDLHDDLGSLLLSGLHKPDLDDTRKVIRDAMFDVRMLASDLGGERRQVSDMLADLRHEAFERLQSAGLHLDWPPHDAKAPASLDFATYKAVRSSMRELISNVIRHAQASHVTVAVRETSRDVRIEIADDGCGRIGTPRPGAMGLAGVSRRMAAVAGSLELPAQDRGVKAVLAFPLD